MTPKHGRDSPFSFLLHHYLLASVADSLQRFTRQTKILPPVGAWRGILDPGNGLIAVLVSQQLTNKKHALNMDDMREKPY